MECYLLKDEISYNWGKILLLSHKHLSGGQLVQAAGLSTGDRDINDTTCVLKEFPV